MFVTLIVIHVLAALLHLYLRNGIFRRMWPAHGSPWIGPRYSSRPCWSAIQTICADVSASSFCFTRD